MRLPTGSRGETRLSRIDRCEGAAQSGRTSSARLENLRVRARPVIVRRVADPALKTPALANSRNESGHRRRIVRSILLAAVALISGTFAAEASARTPHFQTTGGLAAYLVFVLGGGLRWWWLAKKD